MKVQNKITSFTFLHLNPLVCLLYCKCIVNNEVIALFNFFMLNICDQSLRLLIHKKRLLIPARGWFNPAHSLLIHAQELICLHNLLWTMSLIKKGLQFFYLLNI